MILRPPIYDAYRDQVCAFFAGDPFQFSDHSMEDSSFDGLDLPSLPAYSDQVHGTKILVVDRPGYYPGYDGFITQKKGLPLLIKMADCIGALFFHPGSQTIAAIHAGWRGLAQSILRETVRILQGDFQVPPGELICALSPSIHLPVFSDPFRETPPLFHPFITREKKIDLWAIAEDQLLRSGIHMAHYNPPPFCTYSDKKKRFWSHRRKDPLRNGAFISLVP